MTVRDNTIKTNDVPTALDIEFIANFQQEYDRFADIIGLFDVETMAAGTALYQYKVSGSLVDKQHDVSHPEQGSSGTKYTEGDFIARSKYTVTKEQVGEIEFFPYAKQTTAQAILKSGYENAVLRTDRKARQQLRAAILAEFFELLKNGTTTAAPETGTWGLQEVLAYTSAKLADTLEANDDEGGRILYFVNRQDAAAYLAKAPITTQDAFGMTYLENFLGVENVLLTEKVEAGTVYATPADNVHVYGLDFGSLGQAGLNYETNEYGLVGVHHDPDYDYGSANTFLVRGSKFIPEIKDYIVMGSTVPVASTTTTTA